MQNSLSWKTASAIRMALGLSLWFLMVIFPAGAQETSPVEGFDCEKVFGPGFTAIPGEPYNCCFPGTVPKPGGGGCEKPGSNSASDADGNDSEGNQPSGTPSGNVRDAEGREGAPGQHCIPHGATCTLNGAECCSSTDTCSGKFPNTMCQ